MLMEFYFRWKYVQKLDLVPHVAKYDLAKKAIAGPYPKHEICVATYVYASTLLTYFENKSIYDHVVLYEKLGDPKYQRFVAFSNAKIAFFIKISHFF
jgi:hypothetical protein